MSIRFLVTCLVVILIFSSGVAVGQKTAPSRFEKYEGPARFSEMDSRLLEANLALIRDQLESAKGIAVPRIEYDRNTQKVKAITQVNEEFLGQQKSNEVKKNLEIVAVSASLVAGLVLPELQYADQDFEVEFLCTKTGTKRTVYAEYKAGKLTIH